MKKIILGVVILVLVVIAGFMILGDNENKPAPDPNGDTPSDVQGDDQVRLISPGRNAVVTSPLTVIGEARGSWFFEANLPIKIEDSEGNTLAQVGAQAQGEWMTTDFVPFEAVLSFNVPAGETSGMLVIEKDNPSGLPENADSRSFPIRFGESGTAEEDTVEVFFSMDDFGASNECNAVVAVERQIPATQAVARAAINELLDGPTSSEQDAGYVTSIPSGVELNSIRVENGTAFADFSEELNNVGGSCLVTAIRAQIEETLMQFSTVNDVIISVEGGDPDEALQP